MANEKVTQDLWTAVDEYLAGLLVEPDLDLDAALAANAEAGLPAISVSANHGKFLSLLVQISGSRTVLEIGTLGGYSTIWLARALPPDGVLITLELDRGRAEVARRNIERAGLSSIVQVRVGDALYTLERLTSEGAGPFGFVFIDADKVGYPDYLAAVLELSRPGTLIVADNVVRDGAVIDDSGDDPDVEGVRRFLEMCAADPRLSAVALQTVGTKGYDGLALARVIA